MEIRGATLLYALAGMMITFAGFSALLLAVRPASGARLSRLDKFLAKTVMSHIFVLSGGALLPTILALYDLGTKSIWQWSAVLFALPMMTFQVTYPARRKLVTGEAPPMPIMAVFVILGSVATMVMLGYVLAGGAHYEAVYVTGLTIDFFTVAFAFLVALEVILQQPDKDPE